MASNESDINLSVSEFVALVNQTLDFAYPDLVITGELANLRVSKNKWVYFDLKDESSSVKFFGTIYHLPGPLEDGMMLRVRGQPRLHQLYGFSVNVISMQPAGEGSIRKAADLLQIKLAQEGLFDEARKRPLPYPPSKIGLITSGQSAAYADFIKIINSRWGGLDIQLIDVQVQGEPAPGQIVAALEQFNALGTPPEALVLIRGGGSAEDLAAFSTEQVTRAVAASRIPTVVAIGHEVDLSLAELAADLRASTPSNAAELLVPDRAQIRLSLKSQVGQLLHLGKVQIKTASSKHTEARQMLNERMELVLTRVRRSHAANEQLLKVLDPSSILRRGYAVVRLKGRVLRTINAASHGAIVEIQVDDGRFNAAVTERKE